MISRRDKKCAGWAAIAVLAVFFAGCEVLEEVARQSVTATPSGAASSAQVPGGGPGIALSDAKGGAGKSVTISATLSTGRASIAGTQNDLRFDPSVLAIAADGRGKPDCKVNPSINKSASAFAFTPSGCRGKSCKGVRALVLSLTDVKPIANGSRLYSCRVAIAGGAAPGKHMLQITGVSLSTPAGEAVNGKGVSSTITVQ